MRILETFEKDSFSGIITWYEPNGSVKDLTGATVVAFALGPTGTVSLQSFVLDGEAGDTHVSWPASTLSAGIHDLQVRATKDGDTKTYHAKIDVEASL